MSISPCVACVMYRVIGSTVRSVYIDVHSTMLVCIYRGLPSQRRVHVLGKT